MESGKSADGRLDKAGAIRMIRQLMESHGITSADILFAEFEEAMPRTEFDELVLPSFDSENGDHHD